MRPNREKTVTFRLSAQELRAIRRQRLASERLSDTLRRLLGVGLVPVINGLKTPENSPVKEIAQ